MKQLNLLILNLTGTVAAFTSGCSGGSSNFPNPGFTIVTQRVNSLRIETAVPGVVISGVNQRPPDINFTGTRRSFPPTESSYRSALVPVPDGVAPAF